MSFGSEAGSRNKDRGSRRLSGKRTIIFFSGLLVWGSGCEQEVWRNQEGSRDRPPSMGADAGRTWGNQCLQIKLLFWEMAV